MGPPPGGTSTSTSTSTSLLRLPQRRCRAWLCKLPAQATEPLSLPAACLGAVPVPQGFIPYKLLDPQRLPEEARSARSGHPQDGYKQLLGKSLKFKITQVRQRRGCRPPRRLP